jgi:7,8-dihydropterin-6-yl-methyl-4-(beta-D-ribofuranosyl)aminobenzene 5'-phosphate synthase
MKNWIFGLIGMAVLVAAVGAGEGIQVTILYDNYVHTPETKGDWGFACLIEGTEKTILFDTGTQPDIFWHNLRALDIDINEVEQIVISHNHGDHTGGLISFLEKKSDVPVYIPASFPENFARSVQDAGAQARRVSDPVAICENVWSTGDIPGPAHEQGIILNTSQGLVVITGCAHPGIADMVERARRILNKDVYLVFGGFHLMQKSKPEVEAIIERFEKAGIKKCGATHCTGEQQIEWFKQAYGEDFVSMGVGRVIKIDW